MLLKENSLLWDKIEVYERYGEEERILRTRALQALKDLEEKGLGKTKRTQNEPEETSQELPKENEDETPKRQRIMMIRAGEQPRKDESDLRLEELTQRGEEINRTYKETVAEYNVNQRSINTRHIELIRQFRNKNAVLQRST